MSGFWRTPPPNRTWTPGHWQEVDGGWQWSPGFWPAQDIQQVEYLPPPPASIDEGPSVPAPDENSIYVSGCWVYRETRYFWRPGYWIEFNPDWCCIPDHYCWTPAGCILVQVAAASAHGAAAAIAQAAEGTAAQGQAPDGWRDVSPMVMRFPNQPGARATESQESVARAPGWFGTDFLLALTFAFQQAVETFRHLFVGGGGPGEIVRRFEPSLAGERGGRGGAQR